MTSRGGWAQVTLDEVKPGERVSILAVADARIRVQAIRLGLAEGAQARCVQVLPGGPVVIQLGQQELAVGRPLARRISVAPAADRGRGSDR